MFLVGIFVHAVTLMITGWLLPVLDVSNWVAAFFGGLVFAAVNAFVTNLLTIDDEDSFYQHWVERLARRQPFPEAEQTGRGLVMLEIDGLSFWHMERAIAEGWMPTVASMLAQDGYVVSRFDCGLPSQTSACQAGIMFGDNHDIPAFRWYVKSEKKLYVSGRDAAHINAALCQGQRPSARRLQHQQHDGRRRGEVAADARHIADGQSCRAGAARHGHLSLDVESLLFPAHAGALFC